MAVLDKKELIMPPRQKEENGYAQTLLSSDGVAFPVHPASYSTLTELVNVTQLYTKLNRVFHKNAFSGELFRYGNIVHFHHQLNVTVATKNLSWQTIPQGYRPITVERHSFMSINNWNPHLWMTVWVNPDGGCGYISNGSAFTEFWFDMYWITQDEFPWDDVQIDESEI